MKDNSPYWQIAIPIVLLTLAAFALAACLDPEWKTYLNQNLLSELFGVSASVLVTVFFVDRIIKSRQTQQWQPIRRWVYNRVQSNIEMAFALLTGPLNLQYPVNSGRQIAEDLASQPPLSQSALQAFTSSIPATNLPHAMTTLSKEAKETIDLIDDSRYVLADNPRLVAAQLDLKQAFSMLQSAFNLDTMTYGQPTPTVDNSGNLSKPSLAAHYPMVGYPLTQVLRALASVHQKATDAP